MEEIKANIKQIIIKKLGKEVDIEDNTPLAEIGVDSYMIIQIVVDIENTFDIEFEDDKLTYETLKSLKSIYIYVYGQYLSKH